MRTPPIRIPRLLAAIFAALLPTIGLVHLLVEDEAHDASASCPACEVLRDRYDAPQPVAVLLETLEPRAERAPSESAALVCRHLAFSYFLRAPPAPIGSAVI